MNIKLKNLNAAQTNELLPENLVFLSYRGSVAHGMYVPSSGPNSIDDKDLLGVFVSPIEHYLGFGRKETVEKWVGEYDSVYYEFRKFVSMLMKSNPNVLSMLWVDKKYVLHEHPIAKNLRKNRELFVSKAAYHSFSGYANGQFKRMTNCAYKGYMGVKRKTLVDKYGFDTKNGAHLIRLLKMCIEFLVEGKLYVERKSDAQYLLDIKHGRYSLEEIKAEASRLFSLSQEAYVNSKLPDSIDRKTIEKLVVDSLTKHFQERGNMP